MIPTKCICTTSTMQDKTVRDNFSPVSHQVAVIHLIQHVGITLTFIYCIFSFCLYFLSFDPPLASLSFAPSFWRHLSLSLLFPPTQPAHSFIPTLSVSHPYYQLHFNLHPPSLLSDPHVYVCAFHQIYYRTNSTLPPTSGLPVCTAASHTANTTTILQRCYYKLT